MEEKKSVRLLLEKCAVEIQWNFSSNELHCNLVDVAFDFGMRCFLSANAIATKNVTKYVFTKLFPTNFYYARVCADFCTPTFFAFGSLTHSTKCMLILKNKCQIQIRRKLNDSCCKCKYMCTIWYGVFGWRCIRIRVNFFKIERLREAEGRQEKTMFGRGNRTRIASLCATVSAFVGEIIVLKWIQISLVIFVYCICNTLFNVPSSAFSLWFL